MEKKKILFSVLGIASLLFGYSMSSTRAIGLVSCPVDTQLLFGQARALQVGDTVALGGRISSMEGPWRVNSRDGVLMAEQGYRITVGFERNVRLETALIFDNDHLPGWTINGVTLPRTPNDTWGPPFSLGMTTNQMVFHNQSDSPHFNVCLKAIVVPTATPTPRPTATPTPRPTATPTPRPTATPTPGPTIGPRPSPTPTPRPTATPTPRPTATPTPKPTNTPTPGPSATPTPTPTPGPTATPTPTPTVTPTPTPGPTATPTPTPTPGPTNTPGPTPTNAPGEPNQCGGTCGSNNNCQGGYFCYFPDPTGKPGQGFCRNPSCAEKADCFCGQVLGAVAPVAPKTGNGLGIAVGVLVSLAGLGFGARKWAAKIWG